MLFTTWSTASRARMLGGGPGCPGIDRMPQTIRRTSSSRGERESERVGQSWRLQGASLEIRAHGRAAVAGVRPIGRARRPSQRGETPRSASRLKTACYRLEAIVRDRCQRSQWTATRKGLALARASRFDGSIPGAAAEMRVPVASEGRGPGNLLPRRIASLASFVESDIYDLATD